MSSLMDQAEEHWIRDTVFEELKAMLVMARDEGDDAAEADVLEQMGMLGVDSDG
jgi:hypothetical protein